MFVCLFFLSFSLLGPDPAHSGVGRSVLKGSAAGPAPTNRLELKSFMSVCFCAPFMFNLNVWQRRVTSECTVFALTGVR